MGTSGFTKLKQDCNHQLSISSLIEGLYYLIVHEKILQSL